MWIQSKERRRGGVGVIGRKVGGKMRGSKRRTGGEEEGGGGGRRTCGEEEEVEEGEEKLGLDATRKRKEEGRMQQVGT